MPEADMQHILEVKRRHEAELLRKPQVVAVGVGYRTRASQHTDEVCIVVSVTRKIPAAQLAPNERVPGSVEGIPIDVVETGVIRARS